MNRRKFLVYIFKQKSADETRRYPRWHPPLLFFLRGPHFLNFFFSTQAYVSGGDNSMLMFQDFHYANTRIHFHINLNLERLFSLMLNCILILEFKTFSETCRIFFHLCLMLRTSYSCAWSQKVAYPYVRSCINIYDNIDAKFYGFSCLGLVLKLITIDKGLFNIFI